MKFDTRSRTASKERVVDNGIAHRGVRIPGQDYGNQDDAARLVAHFASKNLGVNFADLNAADRSVALELLNQEREALRVPKVSE